MYDSYIYEKHYQRFGDYYLRALVAWLERRPEMLNQFKSNFALMDEFNEACPMFNNKKY